MIRTRSGWDIATAIASVPVGTSPASRLGRVSWVVRRLRFLDRPSPGSFGRISATDLPSLIARTHLIRLQHFTFPAHLATFCLLQCKPFPRSSDSHQKRLKGGGEFVTAVAVKETTPAFSTVKGT